MGNGGGVHLAGQEHVPIPGTRSRGETPLGQARHPGDPESHVVGLSLASLTEHVVRLAML